MPDKYPPEGRTQSEPAPTYGRAPEPNTKPVRDANGRWLPGQCGNPRGRPRKLRPYSDENLSIFSRRLVEITQNGQTIEMSRKRAL
jgi:hypothetical protein